MQISVLSIIFMAVSAVISIGLPIALFIFLYKKHGAKFLPMIIGAAAFIIFALILESAIHFFVLKTFSLKEKPLIYILYGIFMAGIFEETARFISFKILQKKNYTGISTGLSYGVGHGGIEAVLLAGVSMVSAIVLSIIINTGSIEIITNKLEGTALEQMNVQIDLLVTTKSYMFLLSGIERTFAIIIQISLSVIVFYSVFCKNKMWLFPLAILLHAIIDLPAAAYQVGVIKNVLLVEGTVCLSAAGIVVLVINVHKKLKRELEKAGTTA
ncbi:MAG: YhfC family intramembrane metalloprotease [Treponema sp.]|jgi:uncharacterized membrane protein YhfC|nr:YhfC family intramembrane metalloprotease [Treponema sp.]